jgi:hypothetical protein
MQRFGGKAMCKLLTGALTFAILTLAPMSGLAAIVETGGGFSIFDNSTNTSTISVTDDLLVDSLSLTLDIPAGTYAATGIDNAPVSLNAIFNSTSTQGNWTLSITDAATGDQGILAAWALEVETTPPAEHCPASGSWLALLLCHLWTDRGSQTQEGIANRLARSPQSGAFYGV